MVTTLWIHFILNLYETNYRVKTEKFDQVGILQSFQLLDRKEKLDATLKVASAVCVEVTFQI